VVVRDGDDLRPDDDGLELPTVHAAPVEGSRALAEMADGVRGGAACSATFN
jgi:hypothetical protein